MDNLPTKDVLSNKAHDQRGQLQPPYTKLMVVGLELKAVGYKRGWRQLLGATFVHGSCPGSKMNLHI